MTPNETQRNDPGDRGAITAALKAAYDAFLYVGRPCSASHPVRVATIAALMGLEAPDPATARVLDIGCGDGGNLLPMAAALPRASFVGIDISPRSIDEGRGMAADLALDNVTWIAADLRDLPADAGTFDYIIAHGFYSWVPAEVRDTLFATLRTRLSPAGIAFVSHNVLPGCALRRIVWDVLVPHVAGIDEPIRKIAEAKAMAKRMGEAMAHQPGLSAALAIEFREIADRPDFAILHDDLAPVNHPVHLRDIAAHADAHGLAWLADADLFRHAAPAFGDAMNAWLAATDRMTREHVIDHLRLRRYRESLFVRPDRGSGTAPAAARLAAMHVAASNNAVERHDPASPPATSDRSPAAVQRALLDWLVEAHPASVPVAEVTAWIADRAGRDSPLAVPDNVHRLLLSAAYAGVVVPLARPAELATIAGVRPRAFAASRWQASRHDFVVNLRHDGVTFADPVQRRLLPLVDGTRTRDELVLELAAIVPGIRDARRALDEHLSHFAKLGLLEA